ncbi:MAG: LCP family protein [Candidatus Choladocola sp.]|nr:LCP family protein [Candidatus Choladocola sp.]
MPRNREDHSNPYTNGGSNYHDNNKKKPGMNVKKVFAISFCIVLGIVFISGGIIYKLGHDLYSSINYVADEEVKTVETLPEHVREEMTEETISDEERQGVKVSADELDSIHDKMSSLSDRETVSDEDIYNVLLVGVDRRDKSWNGNSDSMILVSINKKENKVSMISLMRDTYVEIPDKGYYKLNAAYAFGAGPLLCETVTNSFKIKVDRYAAVDFFDLIDIIDIIGGVDLEITAKEAEVANGYILDMCNLMDIDGMEHQLPAEGGMVHCDGVQAVAYARNRYVGNSDFQRTERQRYVLTQLMAEVKNMSIAQMTEKMQEILKHVTMNIPETEIWSMITELPEMLEYDFEMDRVPYDNMYDIIYVKGQDMLVPDWDATIEKMHESIYGTEN